MLFDGSALQVPPNLRSGLNPKTHDLKLKSYTLEVVNDHGAGAVLFDGSALRIPLNLSSGLNPKTYDLLPKSYTLQG